MNNFFDLRIFTILFLKRITFIFFATLIFGVTFGAYKAYPFVNQYVNYNPSAMDDKDESDLSDDVLPMSYTVSQTYLIRHDSPNTFDELSVETDRIDRISSMYLSISKSDLVLSPLLKTHFQEVKSMEARARTILVEMNYQYATILTVEYTQDDFSSICNFTSGKDFLTFGITTYSKQLSERILNDYVNIVISEGQKIIPHELTKVSSMTTKTPPVAVTGNPRTNVNTTAVSSERPSLRLIAVKLIRGFAIGSFLGLMLSFLMILFVQVIDLKLSDMSQLQEMKLRVMAIFPNKRKKGLGKLIDKWIYKLDGFVDYGLSDIDSADLFVEQLYAFYKNEHVQQNADSTVSVLLTGSVPLKQLERVYTILSQRADSKLPHAIRFLQSGNVHADPETLRLSHQADYVVLIEQRDSSLVSEINRELNTFAETNKTVLGCILIW